MRPNRSRSAAFWLPPRCSRPSRPRPRDAKRSRRRPKRPARCRPRRQPPRPVRRMRPGGATSMSTARSITPIRPRSTSRCTMPRRCAPPPSARKPSPCSNACRCKIPTTRTCSANTAARWRRPATIEQALDVLGRAHSPDQPDWHILSAQGAVLDQLGRHAEAQRYYQTALKIVPDEPTVLSNLGLSYALSKDLPNAEATLRRAAEHRSVDPRVRQNLALVVGLQGRFAEAEQIASADLPPDQAAANVAYLRQNAGAQRRSAETEAGGARRGRHELIIALRATVRSRAVSDCSIAAPSRGSRPGRESRRTAPAGRTRSSAP